MHYFFRVKKVLLVLTFICFQWLPVWPAQGACTSSNTSGSIKIGSSIVGGSVVVCASSSSAKTTTAVKSSTPSTPKKVVTPIKVTAPPCVIKVSSVAAINDPRVPGCSYLIIAPITPVISAPKSSSSNTTAVSGASDQAAFTPNQVGISSSSSSGLVGQAVIFGAIAGQHSRSGVILGKYAQVDFTPVSYDWSSDSEVGSGGSFAASWTTEGVHSVSLTVTYAVSYSFGVGWIDAGMIPSTASTSVSVTSVTLGTPAKRSPPLLVSGNCSIRPGSYGC